MHNGFNRRFRAAGVISVALLAAACSSSSKSSAAGPVGSVKYAPIPPGPIVFGVSLPLSGATAAFGLAGQTAVNKVGLPAFNSAHPHGIDGHPVQIKILDDASDVTKAVAVANQLVADHVAAVLTVSYNPEAAGQQYAVFNKNKVPVFDTLTGSQYGNTSAWPYDFGTGPSVQQEGEASARWIAAKGFTRVATITDGLSQDTDALTQITTAMKTEAPKAQLVKAVTVPPGSVDLSAAVAQVKAANPDLFIVYLGFGYGPLWNAMRADRFSPQLMVAAGAWYDGFGAMGPLGTTAVAPYADCASSASQTFPTGVKSLMDQYAAASGDTSVNYLTYVNNDSMEFEVLKYAIEKYHSIDPNAIKAAIEGIHNMSFYGITYNFSPMNHYGITGQFAAAVCKMGPPYAGGEDKIPVKAQP